MGAVVSEEQVLKFVSKTKLFLTNQNEMKNFVVDMSYIIPKKLYSKHPRVFCGDDENVKC
jgi:hypothetical protein